MFKDTFKALSDSIRREILMLLKNGRMSAGDIANSFNITAPTVSYHLNLLKKAELIRETKFKNYIYYELNITVFEELILWFNNFKGDDKNV
ncbi:autorepressor SdpR family transcription factor [Streptobacillus felis]|uniref:Winged helix-turn-helix transcriptional regulator n=1 Tax=Streptobacillus felis TaxID=1384509 RepID=A0A7Z0PEW6_9FUSO|nr:autorepressor SdpR family transcription factor [Streptobacillus felis]NYV27897.1 winged helix-turn-helix transcriptional regulator [Streptobacillus felis]